MPNYVEPCLFTDYVGCNGRTVLSSFITISLNYQLANKSKRVRHYAALFLGGRCTSRLSFFNTHNVSNNYNSMNIILQCSK